MILEPVTLLSVVALELVFGEHVVRDDVNSLTELVPLGYSYEDCEEHEYRYATYDVKHPFDRNALMKDNI